MTNSRWLPIQSVNRVFALTLTFGTPLTATLNWDKANHQFVATVKVKGAPGLGTVVAVPYLVPDTAPPANATKNLDVSAHSLNCTSGKTNAQVEATFDNVFTNR